MISKVPANDKEALKSDLLGWNEKRKCKNFFQPYLVEISRNYTEKTYYPKFRRIFLR